MTIAEVLRAGRDVYAANPSHAPSEFQPDPGTACVMVALSRVATNWSPAADALRDVAFDGNRGPSLVDWNAAHTTEEVLAVWDRTIEIAEAAWCSVTA